MANFQIGERVRLKSGGPVMTVQNLGNYEPLGPNPGVLCVWFIGNTGKKLVDTFHPETLEIYDIEG